MKIFYFIFIIIILLILRNKCKKIENFYNSDDSSFDFNYYLTRGVILIIFLIISSIIGAFVHKKYTICPNCD